MQENKSASVRYINIAVPTLKSIFVSRADLSYLISRVYFLNRPDFSHCAFVGYYDVGITAVVHQCYTRRTRGEVRKIPERGVTSYICWEFRHVKRHRWRRSYRNLLCKQESQHLLRKYSWSQMGQLLILDGEAIAVDLEEARKAEELKI